MNSISEHITERNSAIAESCLTMTGVSSMPPAVSLYGRVNGTDYEAPETVGTNVIGAAGAVMDVPVASPGFDVQRRIAPIEPGWSADKLKSFLDDFFAGLALDRAAQTHTSIDECLDKLNRRLRKSKYPTYEKRQCRVMLDAATRHLNGATGDSDEKGEDGERVDREDDRFVAVNEQTQGARANPEACGIWDRKGNEGDGEFLTNFTLVFERDVEVVDDLETKRVFEGLLTLFGEKSPFRIASDDFGNNNKLMAAIYSAGGPEVQIRCAMDLLRQAISAISRNKIARRQMTTNFGWTEDGSAFLVPSGRITKDGFEAATADAGLRVDLEGEEQARHLDLRFIADQAELRRVKKHLVEDLLTSHDQRVTYCLLGSVGAAILYRFGGEIGRFGLWLTGLTGSGKSFLAKLFMNFFGNYPSSFGHFATWASTSNYIQRQGYFFKDALYLVDDYKPEVMPVKQIIRVLQNYADGTGRGRLKVDATTNTTRSIRGLLLSTGEDIPEHSASALARSIIVTVPQQEKDLARGKRCLGEAKNYSAVTADFVRWLLADNRTRRFTKRVELLQQFYYQGIAGQQNDVRIASNFAVLGAGLVVMGRFLKDVWPSWWQDVKRFLTTDLVAIRDEMLNTVREQQASEIFLATLRELFRNKRVRVTKGGADLDSDKHMPIIGKEKNGLMRISMPMAMEQVQESLHRQARPPLSATSSALLAQLRQDGKLLNPDGTVLSATGKQEAEQRIRIAGKREYCFTIDAYELKEPRPLQGDRGISIPGRGGAGGAGQGRQADETGIRNGEEPELSRAVLPKRGHGTEMGQGK